MRTIGEGDRVLFVTQRGKRYLVSVKRGERFHTSEGYVEFDDVIGKRYGSRIKTNTGSVWTAFEPTILDHVLNFPRITQIVYPKDLGYIILMSGVRCGSRVVEGGTGSAVLTAVLAYQFGDGFTNMIIPTSGVTVGTLAMAKIPFQKWARWNLPMQVAFFVLSLALLVWPVLTGWE